MSGHVVTAQCSSISLMVGCAGGPCFGRCVCTNFAAKHASQRSVRCTEPPHRQLCLACHSAASLVSNAQRAPDRV